MEKMPITFEGLSRLQEELKRLKSIERPSVIKALEEARTHGDLSENAEYHAARERQSFIEGRVAELEDKIRRAEVIDVSKLTGKAVKFEQQGDVVRMLNLPAKAPDPVATVYRVEVRGPLKTEL